MKKISALLLLLAFTLPGCEKDDICSAETVTTPRLVIEFYNQGDRDATVYVSNLQVQADGMDQPIVFDDTKTDGAQYLVSGTSVKVPLDTTKDSITYTFTINANNETFRNPDKLTFHYARNNVFISRACGYGTFFGLDRSSQLGPYTLEPDANLWIKDIDVVTYNLTSENETHLKFFL